MQYIVTLEIYIYFIVFSFVFQVLYSLNQNVAANIKRTSLFEGFHRYLVYDVSTREKEDFKTILLVEDLPAGVYVDPYQIFELTKHGKLDILLCQNSNTELPAYLATSSRIIIQSSSLHNTHKIEIPIHLRYHRPHKCYEMGTHVVVNLNKPLLYTSRNVLELNTIKNLMCGEIINGSWTQVKILAATSQPHFNIPVGCIEHFPVIYIGTFAVMSLSTIYLGFILGKVPAGS